MRGESTQKGKYVSVSDEVVEEVLKEGKCLSEVLRRAIKRLGIPVSDFSQRAGIPASTLYKILSGEREPNLRTFRKIVSTLRALESPSHERRKFIAVIGSRGILDNIERKEIKCGEETLEIREYAVTTIEEAMIAAIQAEREGASALVCAPILSPTVEKIVRLPVATIKPRGSVIRAIELAAKKITA